MHTPANTLPTWVYGNSVGFHEWSASRSSLASCQLVAERFAGPQLVPGTVSASEYAVEHPVGGTSRFYKKLQADCTYEFTTSSSVETAHFDLYGATEAICGLEDRISYNWLFDRNGPHHSASCFRNGTDLTPERNVGEQCASVGNPIGLGFGNKYQVERDFTQRNLVLNRYYNSVLGAWRHEYEREVLFHVVEDTSMSPVTKTYVGRYVTEDGRGIRFQGTTDVAG